MLCPKEVFPQFLPSPDNCVSNWRNYFDKVDSGGPGTVIVLSPVAYRQGGTRGQEGGEWQIQHRLCVGQVGVSGGLALCVHTCRAPTSFPCTPTHLSRGTAKEGLSSMGLTVTEGLKFGFLKISSPKIC